jgi:hypothetical protein
MANGRFFRHFDCFYSNKYQKPKIIGQMAIEFAKKNRLG